MSISTQPGVWISAICTIGLLSFLYGDNRMFKTVESAFIGFGAAHMLVLGFHNILNLAWNPLTKRGDILSLVPLMAGLLLYTRFYKPYSWVSRFPLQYLYGVGAGVAIRGVVGSQVLAQVSSTIFVPKNLNQLILIIGVLATISYFFFTFGNRIPVLRHSAKLGHWVMMGAFGAAFGNYVMGRTSVLIARLTFVWGDWLGLIK